MAEVYLPLPQSEPSHYGGIVVGPRIPPGNENEGSEDLDSSQDLWITASEGTLDDESFPPVCQQPVCLADTETPGERAPSRRGYLNPALEQEEEEVTCSECCKCCKSWDDWCLFLSCSCSSSPSIPMHERKYLRAARTEGWRLLWSFLIPLTVGSVPLQLMWAIAQLVVAIAVFITRVTIAFVSDTLCPFHAKLAECKGELISLIFATVWFQLCTIDVISCCLASRFYRAKFNSSFSVYISGLRLFYTFLCLLLMLIGDSISQKFTILSGSYTCTLQAHPEAYVFLVMLALIAVFVDVMLLVIAVRFALKSLKLCTYTRSVGWFESFFSVDTYLVLRVFGEVIVHVCFLYSAFSVYIIAITKGNAVINSSDTFEIPCDKNWTISTSSVVLSLVAPSIGILSVYFVDYYRFQKYLINVYLSACHLAQDRARADELNIPADLYDKLQTRLSQVQQIDTCIELTESDAYLKHFWQKVSYFLEGTHSCFSPFPIIYCICIIVLWGILFTWLILFYNEVGGLIITVVLILTHVHVAIVFIFFVAVVCLLLSGYPLIILLIIWLLCYFCCCNYRSINYRSTKCMHFIP